MVFKRLADRLASAGASAAAQLGNGWNASAVAGGSAEHPDKIRTLESMGFDANRARHALNATGGDVDRAAELLLLSHADGDGAGPTAAAAPAASGPPSAGIGNGGGRAEGAAVAARNEEQMRLAVEESLRIARGEEGRNVRAAEAASMGQDRAGGRRRATATIDPTGNNDNTREKKGAPRKPPPQKPKQKAAPRTAAQIRAGKAATARMGGAGDISTGQSTLHATHPAVKLPTQLKDKSREERILRCADRIKSHSMAADTVLRALGAVRANPDEAKYREIDRSNVNYARHVKDKPGAEDMLLAANYRLGGSTHGMKLILERHLVDDALLYLAVSALEQVRTSPEYLDSKRWRKFHADAKRIADAALDAEGGAGMTAEETSVRIGFLSKCPTEPPEGRGARISIILGDPTKDPFRGTGAGAEGIRGGTIARRFDGDDTLDDVLNWMGGRYGREPLDRIRSREFCLCDLNRYPILPLDAAAHGKKTLQYLGCFPSGRLGMRPSDDAWREGGKSAGGGGVADDVVGSSRGLGAASTSLLQR